MKKLILLELTLLFLATTFSSDPPPGWYQQQLPVNDFINDIFFLDSLRGWVITNGGSNDTAYIMKTTDGGNNWQIQIQQLVWYTAVQFLDSNVGYVVGSKPPGLVQKTTNGGNNWFTASTIAAAPIRDLSFVNKDTGWICSDDIFDGGVFKTIDGGMNWIRLTNPGDFTKLFFLNKDTGWVNANGTQKRLYRTTDGGTNWDLQFTFPQQINDIFFMNGNDGYVSLPGKIYKSKDCGDNWIPSPSDVGGIQLSFVSDSVGWAGYSLFKISKTLTGGENWFYQTTPTGNNYSVNSVDSLKAWAGGINLIHTTDGGGLSGINMNAENIPNAFLMEQNFPNPFNPLTVISYGLRITSHVKLSVYDIQGKEFRSLIDKKQTAGNYKIEFDGSELSSGVYFYRIEVSNEKTGVVYVDTKKMILIR